MGNWVLHWAHAEFVRDDAPLSPIAVPDPASSALLAVMGLGLLRRRR